MATIPTSPEADHNKAYKLLIVTWVGCSLSLIFVGLRLYSRVWLTKNLWWDDWTILITMVLTITYSVFFTLYAAKGGARHISYMTPTQLEEVTMINWVSQTFCVMAIATGKISVAILMGRLMSPNRRRKWILYFLSISSFIAACLIITFIFAQCSPPRALWIPSAGKCWDLKKVNDLDVSMGSWFAFVDFSLAIFGITLVWKLQIDKQRKAGLMVLLSMGIFASICAAVKTSYLPTLTAHSDFTWITVNLLIWNALEINIIIIAACIPTTPQIFLNLFTTIQSKVSVTRKSHSKLSSQHEPPSYELQNAPTKALRQAQNASHESTYGWQNDSSSQTNIVPMNRILEVKDLDLRFEERDKEGGRDEERGESGIRAAISASTVL